MGGRWGVRACSPTVGLQQQGLISYRGRNPGEQSGQVGDQEACARPVTRGNVPTLKTVPDGQMTK